MHQEIPANGEDDINCLLDYVNLEEDDELMFLVYLISCFIPGVQHLILNIWGEAGTGKTTISKIIKDLVDSSKSMLNDFSDQEDGRTNYHVQRETPLFIQQESSQATD